MMTPEVDFKRELCFWATVDKRNWGNSADSLLVEVLQRVWLSPPPKTVGETSDAR